MYSVAACLPTPRPAISSCWRQICVRGTGAGRCSGIQRVHWRQLVLLLEIALLFLAGFLPQAWNVQVNVLVSFVCAMQVQTFRKVHGKAFASTMCIGNLRSATEAVFTFRHTGDREALRLALEYFGVLVLFAVGAACGSFLSVQLGERAIWVCCGLLTVSLCVMFVRGSAAQ